MLYKILQKVYFLRMAEKRVLVLLFPGFEEIEAFVPIDLLRRVGIEVVLASLGQELEIKGAHGICCQADILLSSLDLGRFDGFILPGGPGVFDLQENEDVLKLIQYFYRQKKLVAAICAAPIVLKAAGCLPVKFTAHACVESVLEGCNTQVSVITDENKITARGPGAAFLFAFEIIQRLTSDEVVLKLKESIHYEK